MAGFTLDRESIARISQMLRSYEQGMLSPPDIPGPDGSYTPAVQVVKVTGAKDAAGWQPGTIQIWNNASSSFTTGITCHIRASDGSTLATNSRLLGRLSSVESNVPVFIVDPAGGLGTVDEVDGSPSYTSINRLTFDQSDGFSLSNPATGQVRIDIQPASTSQTGVVNTTTQSFSGYKVFEGQVVAPHSAAGFNDIKVYSNIYFTSGYASSSSPSGYHVILQGSLNGTYGLFTFSKGGGGTPYLFKIEEKGSWDVEVGTANYYGFTGYRSKSGSSFYIDGVSGLTGTLKTGAISTGGIITNLGNTSVQSSSWMGF